MELSKTARGTEAKRLLTERFGIPSFRPGQAEVIDRVLDGKNVAAVFPTGGGKSLCYQLPSQMLDGTTVVVSPLIALMKDQCDALAARGIQAARLDSSLSHEAFREAMRGIRDGSIRILYVAPERFFNERFLTSIGSINVSLFAVDEAHCISQWGHNFRPDYLKLAELAKRLDADRLLALTATATPEVLEDIRKAFDIAPEDAIRTPFHRQNLKLRSRVVDAENQFSSLLQCLQEGPTGSALVYVTKQRTAETVAEQLQACGLNAAAYHAGMAPESRAEVQRQFLESDAMVVVATIAFGMGIDKGDIRGVYHYNPPKSLESYAQEIGRAGRDGKVSHCEMLLQPEDRVTLENFSFGDTPELEGVQRLIELCHAQADEFFLSHYKVSYESDVRILVARTLLTYMELDGHLATTSPRYDSYKIHPLVTSEAILQNFEGERREFVAGLLGQLTKSRKWFTLNMVAAAKALGEPRERLVRAVDFMAAQNWIELRVSDLVHGYRWINRIDSPAAKAQEYFDRLRLRETADVSRLDEVFELASAGSCQAAFLAEHFGESMEQDCGDCSYCRGLGPHQIPSPPERRLGDGLEKSLTDLSHQHPELLGTAPQLTRFLCGLSSPRMVRARLSRHDSFGVCDRIPFRQVLHQVETLMQNAEN